MQHITDSQTAHEILAPHFSTKPTIHVSAPALSPAPAPPDIDRSSGSCESPAADIAKYRFHNFRRMFFAKYWHLVVSWRTLPGVNLLQACWERVPACPRESRFCVASHANQPIDCDSQNLAPSWEHHDEWARPTSWCISTVFVGDGNRWGVFCDRPEPHQNLRNAQVVTITKRFTLQAKSQAIYPN